MPNSIVKRMLQSRSDHHRARQHITITLQCTGRPTAYQTLPRKKWNNETLSKFINRATKNTLTKKELVLLVNKILEIRINNNVHSWTSTCTYDNLELVVSSRAHEMCVVNGIYGRVDYDTVARTYLIIDDNNQQHIVTKEAVLYNGLVKL